MLRIIVIALICLAVSSQVMAKEITINQKSKKFSSREVSIGVGDVIKFVNDDKVTHNVHSTTKGNDFDVGAQKPGTTEGGRRPMLRTYPVAGWSGRLRDETGGA